MGYKYVGATNCVSQDELELLEGNAPDLEQISPNLCVAYKVVRLKSAQLVWLNLRWLKDQGIDPDNIELLDRVKNWIVSEFGYVVDTPEAHDDQLDREDERIFLADRYGSNSGLVAHGGSGRASVVGRFHIKGVGRTPLVGRGVNREHSHGSASLNVAIREAIYSEIVHEEFPHKSVPVIAIVNTGLEYESSGVPSRKLRRAIIVRPSMIRPAHLQRAAGFIDPVDGHANSQLDDCFRVEEVVSHIFPADQDLSSKSEKLYSYFCRVAEQIAFGQVHRLYSGGYFSSNISIEASLLDFGNMHALPNWINLKVLDNDLGFGREMLSLESTVISLSFYIRKFGSGDSFEPKVAMHRANSAYHAKFREETIRVLGLSTGDNSDERETAVEIFRSIYAKQQRIQRNYTASGHSSDRWPFDKTFAYAGDPSSALDESTKALIEACERFAECSKEGDSPVTLELARARYLATRDCLIRDRIQTDVDDLLESNPLDLIKSVDSYISSVVSRGRRHWRNLDANHVVTDHAYLNGDSVLWGFDPLSKKPTAWLEGSVICDTCTFFGARLPLSGIIDQGADVSEGRWRIVVAQDSKADFVELSGVVVRLPKKDFSYSS
ncbi:hypothetical protein V3391_07605 [Luteimonas sp. SMYT11W]|uniref:Uncharacterized protein n=1 Tax=Luteimonas flava TaxID=3115822 RepID=A0ABU7WDM6_9GAMM